MTDPDPAAEIPRTEAVDLQQLYSRYARELWAVFYSVCGDPERAQDGVQEAFLRLQSYCGESIRDHRAWLLRVGQNWLRDQARRRGNSCILLPGLDDRTQGQMSASDVLALSERQQLIRESLQELNEDDRRALVMKYSMDWSSARMGQVLGCSAAAIDMRLSRARRRLSEILEARGIDHV
ncbi:MAG: RNA polymerase sigma factor [Planctomycetaceae bacterium]